VDTKIVLALLSGAIGLCSGLITSYAAMRLRLREERARWNREFAVKFAEAKASSPPMAKNLAEQFAVGLLVISEPGKERRRVFISPAGAICGRGPDCDLIIDDRSVSRMQARFLRREDGIYLEDLWSSGWTTVNDVRIVNSSVKLETGDVIGIGDARITFVALG
jgi:pSer/pThr/pTyr-binding forkhead associated (FHA) protein